MDHCLQQISSEIPILLTVMLRGQTPSAVPAKGFAGSSKCKLIHREELSIQEHSLAAQQKKDLR